MIPDNTIYEEIKAISDLVAGVSRQHPYKVPAGYFENFADRMLLLAKSQEGTGFEAGEPDPGAELQQLSPLLAGLSKKSPFRVPEGYFEQVAGEINAGVSALEQANEILETLSPTLEAARHLQPYKVPDGYFEQLPQVMLEKVRGVKVTGKDIVKQEAKVVGMGRSWFRYAAAAAITGLILISAWWYNQNNDSSTEIAGAGTIPAQLQAEMDQLSDDVIFDYADSVQSIYMGAATASNADLSEPVFHYLLNDVSDEALQQYLAEQPGKTL